MNEKEALTRVKTGNFNGGFGFDMQLLVNAVGIAGEMFKNGQISEVVRCRDCLLRYTNKCVLHDQAFPINKGSNWFCADGKHKED